MTAGAAKGELKMTKRFTASHGIVCRLAGAKMGYFGWPSVARLHDGTLVAVSSGLRSEHVCPWGKTVANSSADDGLTWSSPRIINDSPLDDRDAGVVHLGGGRLLVSWFTSDTRQYRNAKWCRQKAEEDNWDATLSTWTDEIVRRWLGSWVMLSEDRGATWSDPIRVPVSTPHGPARLANGDLLYLGKDADAMGEGRILAARSRDGGRTWSVLGAVHECAGTMTRCYHEPHVVELSSGKLLGMIRVEQLTDQRPQDGLINFSLFQTESSDGGATWTTARPTGIYGSPPHLLRHSSGTLICVYGYRKPGYGQRAMLSRDDGATWDTDWIIRDDGPDGDLGYPASAELADGSIMTVYYQKAPSDQKCSLLWSRWVLPED
jgi:sialidase-1